MSEEKLKESKRSFDKWAEKYDETFLDYILFGRVQRRVAGLLGNLNHKAVLDVGCGTASMLVKLAKKNPGSCFIGIDLSEEMIKKARKKSVGLKNLEFKVSEVSKLNYPKDSFDYITSTISFHHWPEQEKALEKLRGFLKPGGKLIIADLSTFLFGGPGTTRKYNPEEMRELFSSAGFEKVEQVSSTKYGNFGYGILAAGILVTGYGIVSGNPYGYLGIPAIVGGVIDIVPNLISKITIGEK